MFSFFGTIIKYGFYVGAAAVVGAGFFAHSTKPSDSSFTTYIAKSANLKTPDFVNNIVMDNVIKPEIKDWVFFKTAKVDRNIYIGAVNNWFGK